MSIMRKSVQATTKLEELILKIHEVEAARMGVSVEVNFVEGVQPYMATTNYFVQQNIVGAVVSVDAAHGITYCADAIQKLINGMFFTKRARRLGAKYVVFHTVRHELRHVWQTIHNKELLMGRSFHLDTIDGYGRRPQEADANQYAESMDLGKYNVILQACTLNQDLAGKISITKEENKHSKHVLRGLLAINIQMTIGIK